MPKGATTLRSRGERSCWAGVDVGARRKGFHAAIVDASRVIAGPIQLPDPSAVVRWLLFSCPRLIGVDSPARLADAGRTMRECEREFRRARICGIRPTPSPAALARQKRGPNPTYYEWIEHGLELHAALRRAGLTAIECFPTASWTRWAGARGRESRSSWSAAALASLGLRDVPSGLGQDGRDAIGAAVTARAHDRGETEKFGEIVVPLARRSPTSTTGASRARARVRPGDQSSS